MHHQRLILLNRSRRYHSQMRPVPAPPRCRRLKDRVPSESASRSASSTSSVCRSASASRSSAGGCPQMRRAQPWRTPTSRKLVSSAGDFVRSRVDPSAIDSRSWHRPTMSWLIGSGANGTLRFGSGSSPAEPATAAESRRPPAGNPPAPPSSHRPECRQSPAPASDKFLHPASRYRAKHCRR